LNNGSVEGQLVQVSEPESDGVGIVVVDRAFRVRVTAHLGAQWVQAARDASGGRILIEGRVLRDAERGRPIRVYDVISFKPLKPIDDGALLCVAGIWEAPPGFEIITARAADLDNQPEDD